MAKWTFSGGTTVSNETHGGAAYLAWAPAGDPVAQAIRVDIELVEHGFPVAVQILPPISERLDLKNAQIVDLWARNIAARHGQTVTVDTKIEPFDLGPQEHDPKRIY